MVSIAACYAEDPGSIPDGGVCTSLLLLALLPPIGAQLLLHIFQEGTHPDLHQEPADLQSATLTTELCIQMTVATASFHDRSTAIIQAFISFLCLRRRLLTFPSISPQLSARVA